MLLKTIPGMEEGHFDKNDYYIMTNSRYYWKMPCLYTRILFWQMRDKFKCNSALWQI